MKVGEANKIIAEYMGYTVYPNDAEFIPQDISHVKQYALAYDKSFDSLIFVLEKLGKDFDCYLCRNKSGDVNGWVFYFQGCKIEHQADSLQQAACIATARAILELRDNGR